MYPFSYILPPQLPLSFEETYDNVRYYIKATGDRSWQYDYEDKIPLNVFSPLDLNDLLQLCVSNLKLVQVDAIFIDLIYFSLLFCFLL